MGLGVFALGELYTSALKKVPSLIDGVCIIVETVLSSLRIVGCNRFGWMRAHPAANHSRRGRFLLI